MHASEHSAAQVQMPSTAAPDALFDEERVLSPGRTACAAVRACVLQETLQAPSTKKTHGTHLRRRRGSSALDRL
jgi:hypothetical protein